MRVGDMLVSVWRDIDAALSPVLGKRGVAALYTRSIHVAGRTHPWLARLHPGSQSLMDLNELLESSAQQSNADVTAAAEALMHAFSELLTSVIGLSLTERLLRPVLNHISSAPVAQDDPQ